MILHLALCTLSLLNTGTTTCQDQGVLVIHYEFKNDSHVTLDLSMLVIAVEGDVSNSASEHSSPRLSEINIRPREENLIKYQQGQSNEASLLWRGRSKSSATSNKDIKCDESATAVITPVSIKPESHFSIEIRISHNHIPYGEYHPLLGKRTIKFQGEGISFKDSVHFDSENYVSCRASSIEYPETHSHPDYPNTLFLSMANGLGASYMHSFSDIRVRYNTKMVLEFRYMVARNSNVVLNIRIGQYMDGLNFYRPKDPALDETINVVNRKQGMWLKYKTVVQIDPTVNLTTLMFKLFDKDDSQHEIGDVFIKDIKFYPVLNSPTAP